VSTSAKKKGRVFVGLSGGVDSAVSAALLQQEGYDVTGVFVRIALPGYACTAGEDRREALRVAAHLHIPFRDIDLSREYEEKIFRLSLDAYRRGETPNPDALCNREIKFGLLWDFVMSEGADYLATGHYAQIKDGLLYAGVDGTKDQSYFLWAVPGERLQKTLFPVGGLEKKEVRALAKKFDLPNADRRDSQGLCFLGGVTMDEALMKELAPIPGDVLDDHGTVIGSHHGAVLYTIGQRHGFDVHTHTPSTEPFYVTEKDVLHNTITVGPKLAAAAHVSGMATVPLREENWIGPVEVGQYTARFRYRQKLMHAKLTRADMQATAALQTAESIPVGQSLVLYDGERCLGGGIIEATSH
jgi:tRNA-specific 2-thiouridylase